MKIKQSKIILIALGLFICNLVNINADSNICDVIYPKVVIYHDSTNEDSNAQIYAVKLRNLIGHFKADVILRDITTYSAGDMNQYYVAFYIGSAFDIDLPEQFYTDAADPAVSLVWFNYNIWKLLGSTNDTSHLGFQYNWNHGKYDQVLYKSEELFRNSGPTAYIMETNGSPVVHAYMKFATNNTDAPVPYALQSSNFWYFADNPMAGHRMGGRSLVLADLLHDILGSSITTNNYRGLIRLEDLNAASTSPNEINAVVSSLSSINIPATFGVIPRAINPAQGKDISISQDSEFQSALLNIKRSNSEILSHGYTHQRANQVTADGWEYWDDSLSQPVSYDSWSWASGTLINAMNEFMKIAIPVTVWETPHYEASLLDYNVFANNFRTLFERVAYTGINTEGFTHNELEVLSASNPEISGQMIPYMIYQHSYGNTGTVLPENLDYISPGSYDNNGLEKNVSNRVVYAEKMQVVRDAVISGFYHPFLGTQMLTNMVQQIAGLDINYVSSRSIAREFPIELDADTNSLVINDYARVISAPEEIDGDLVTGKFGNGNILNIISSSIVECRNLFAGMNAASVSNAVSVSGASIVCSGVVAVGLNGCDNSMTVTNGGVIETAEGALGYFGGADNNTAIVSGAGSVWSNHFGFYIGPETSGNGLRVEQGGILISQFGELGGNLGADMNVAEISGNGSVWSNSNHLVVGAKGNDNELIITNGGCVIASYAYAGLDYFATNNSITVSGSNSCLQVANSLTIGADGPQNKLMILDGGTVVAEDLVVGMYDRSVSNEIIVAGGFLNVSNTIDIRRGDIVFTNGTTAAELMLVEAGATVQIYEGFNIDNINIITNEGTIILHGDITIPGELHLVGNGVVERISNIRDVIYPEVAIYLTSTNSAGYDMLYGVLLRNLIGHFKAKVDLLNVNNYIAGDMNQYKAIFYIGTDYNAGLSDSFLADSINTQNTFVWIQYGIWELLWSTNDTSRLGFDYQTGVSDFSFDQVSYKGEKLFKHANYHDSYITTNNSTPVVHAWMESSTNGAVTASPYVIQSSNFWYIADNPVANSRQGGRILVFADLLHDILGSGITTNNYRGLIRLEDVNALSTSATDVNNISEELAAMNISGTFGVIPRAVNPPQGKDLLLSENPDILSALVNIRRNGSDILTHGYTHQHSTQVTAVAWEFWDDAAAAPLSSDSWDWATSRLHASKNEFMNIALPTVVWETPHYEGSFVDCNVFADEYRAIYERLRYTGYDTIGLTHGEMETISAINPDMAAQMIPYKVIQDSYGTSVSVIPENIDYISPGSYDFNGLEQNISNKLVYAEKVQVVRDAVVSGYYHTYFGVEILTNMLHQLRDLNIDYVPVRDLVREFPLELNQSTNQLVVDDYQRYIDSSKDIIGDLVTGRFGSNNSLDIDSNIEVTSINTFIGMEQGAVSNILSVSGSGTVMRCKSVMVAGLYGSDNAVYVINAGTIVSSEGALGYFSGADNNAATVSGIGSVWSNHFGFYVGPETSGNGLRVEQGGMLVSQFGELGGNIGADMNIVEISGNGSVWSNSNHLVVGAKGNDNELIITNGGCVFASYAFAGLDYFATNNSITVSGSNSCMQVENRLTIGADGSQSKLIILDGGTVVADELIVGMYDRSVSNEVTVAGGFLNVSNLIDVRRGEIKFNAGSVGAEVLLISENGSVSVSNGFTLDAVAIITNAGIINLKGDVTVAGNIYNVNNGVINNNGHKLMLGGDYSDSGFDKGMTNRVISFSGTSLHLLDTASQNYGDDLVGFSGNYAFADIGVAGTVTVVNVTYSWSLSGSGTLDISDGGRFYYVDASDWSGTVNLSGDAVFEKVNIELSDISADTPYSSTLVWPAGSGILFSVEWVDNLVTGMYAPAASIRATSNSVMWSDTGSVDRLPPREVPTRFYRLQAKP